MALRAQQEKPWAKKKTTRKDSASSAENAAEGAGANTTLAEAMPFDSNVSSLVNSDGNPADGAGNGSNADCKDNASTKRNRDDISATPQKPSATANDNSSDGNGNNKREDDEEQQKVRTPPPLDQGPTPYWKAMEERGRGTSPKLTRSAAKKKQAAGFARSAYANGAGGGDVLFFSPPDQVRNAERERREIRAKEDNRCVLQYHLSEFICSVDMDGDIYYCI